MVEHRGTLTLGRALLSPSPQQSEACWGRGSCWGSPGRLPQAGRSSLVVPAQHQDPFTPSPLACILRERYEDAMSMTLLAKNKLPFQG